MVVCYLCGREFGSQSISIHEKSCIERWQHEEKRPMPSKPKITDHDAYNEAAREVYNEIVRVECPNCHRKFDGEDRLNVHIKGCKPGDHTFQRSSSRESLNSNHSNGSAHHSQPNLLKKTSSTNLLVPDAPAPLRKQPSSPSLSAKNSHEHLPHLAHHAVSDTPPKTLLHKNSATNLHAAAVATTASASAAHTHVASHDASSARAKFCSKCGKPFAVGDNFCGSANAFTAFGGLLATAAGLFSFTSPFLSSSTTPTTSPEKSVIAVGGTQITLSPGSSPTSPTTSSPSPNPIDRARDILKHGFPGPKSDKLYHLSYVGSYDRRLRNAHWVAERLTKESLEKKPDDAPSRQKSQFKDDVSIPVEYRAGVRDYIGSGYDRGHLIPAADVTESQLAINETFLIILGLKGSKQYMGGFVLPNDSVEGDRPVDSFVMPVPAIERSSGLEFFPQIDKKSVEHLCKLAKCNYMLAFKFRLKDQTGGSSDVSEDEG
ncbi:nuclease [Blyttiomyces sp. JEL0837]|nr:nuclease [Blyttiomyces sp. JEL0837]